MIDSRINMAYQLFPNNYIAHDLLYGNTKYRFKYTEQQYHAFVKRLSVLNKYDTCELDRLKEIFLGIYANPIENKLSLIK